MKILSKPVYADSKEVFEWVFKTEIQEGTHLVFSFIRYQENMNWLLLYAWCYVRTKGFTDECMRRWDIANIGGNYESYEKGLQNAAAEFLKYDDTSMLQEEEEVLKIYEQIENFCKDFSFDPPQPIPEPPKPQPQPMPQPPQPMPEPPEPPKPPEKPPEAPKKFPWSSIILSILTIAQTALSIFLPGWAKILLSLFIKIFESL